MTIGFAVLLVVAGLALLAGGGELLVRGATAIAAMAGLTPAVIGLTVVALGTSLPELVVSVIAALGGQPDLAVGNVVGSNIFNITFILGISALAVRLPIRGNLVRIEWPVMFLASLVCVVVARDGLIDRLEAGTFVVALAAFVAYSVRAARIEATATERRDLATTAAGRGLRGADVAAALAATVAGVALLVLGGKLLVDGSVRLAQLAGMSERVIGLTIIAVGTSAPEIATSLVAAYRKQSDIAIANLIGSNIFNVLGILGVTGLILPVQVTPALLRGDMLWMLGVSVLLFGLMWLRKSLSRIDGAILLAAYAAWLFTVLRPAA